MPFPFAGSWPRASRAAAGLASVDAALLVAPVGLAQHALQDLAGGVARDRLEEVDRLRALVVRDAAAHELDDLRRARLGARLEDDAGLDRLAPGVVGHADRRIFGERRVLHG